MKKQTVLSLLVVAGLSLSGASEASLHDRGYGLIYDDVLDVTWLQDANYAKTLGYPLNGQMSWTEANNWAATLSYHAGQYGTIDDWRLPGMKDTAAPGCDFSASGGADCGFNVQTRDSGTGEVFSELAYMFHENLANLSANDATGNFRGGSPGIHWGLANVGLFDNLESHTYWSALEYAPTINNAWAFSTASGRQINALKINQYYAWAVRDGDVTVVPVPAAVWLMGSALFGLAGFTRKR